MSRKLYFFLPIFTFILGYIIADVKNLEQEKTDRSNPEQNSHTTLTETNADSDHLNLTDTIRSFKKPSQLTIEDKQHIQQLIDNAANHKIEKYLDQAFPNQDLDVIYNKKLFAQRVLEELSNNDIDTKPLDGRLMISTTPVVPNQSMNIESIHAQQAIFAHFDTFGKVPKDTQIFIKWMNTNTEQVLLFTPKYIQPNSTQNWVNTIPENGWKIGNYNIVVYQMNDALTPIAQTNYTLTTVVE